jgi:3'-5' exoribonuclease
MAQAKLKELKAGDSFVGFCIVKSKRIRQTRDDRFFIDVDLQDASGSLNAKIWDDYDRLKDEFERGDVVKVEASIEQYKDQLQAKIKRLRKSRPEDPVDMGALMPITREDIDSMYSEVLQMIEEIKNPHLKELLYFFFDDEETAEKIKRAPAARNIHQAYVGGLLEHVWHMAKSGRALLREVYPQIDADLVIAGILIHDLGKLQELELSPAISYTKLGYLEGHIFLGLKMLDEKLRKLPDFPDELRLQLEHIILSHHGEKEFGSPVLPATPEAMLIHQIDNLDAKLAIVQEAILADLNEAEDFTNYLQVLERHIYKRRPDYGGDEE